MDYNFCVNVMFVLCLLTKYVQPFENPECGILSNKNNIPWTVGVYLEKDAQNLELICLGTVLKDNYILTAAQCLFEALSKDLRKENIYVSKDIQKVLARKSNNNPVKIPAKNIIKPKEYQGFLINPLGDLALLKAQNLNFSEHPVCLDWSDLNKLVKRNNKGISSIYNSGLKTIPTSLADYDFCSYSSSEQFARVLSADKICLKTPASNLDFPTLGSGIYYQNPKDGFWYIEGVVSGIETTKNEALLAATSVRRYLSWLSHACAV